MKKKIKVLLGILLFLSIFVMSNKIYAASDGKGTYATLVIDKTTIGIGDTINAKVVATSKSEEKGYELSSFIGVTNWGVNKEGVIKYSDNTKSTKNARGYTTTQTLNTSKITGKSEGTVQLQVKIIRSGTTTASGRKINSNFSETLYLDIKVVKQTVEDAQKDVDNAEKTLTDMKTAYKNIPDKNADANEIDTFIKSDAKYNDLKNLRRVEIDKAKKWRATINDDMIDTISRQLYYETLITLDNYINGGDLDAYKENLSNKLSNAESATETTLNEYKKKLMLAKMDEGDDRTDNPVDFVDVLDNAENYIPTDEASDGRLESKVSIILTVITNIGIVLAVLMVAILGVKYMLGSVEEKAEYKKDMIPYLVGACLLFGITVIVKVLQQIGQSINNI